MVTLPDTLLNTLPPYHPNNELQPEVELVLAGALYIAKDPDKPLHAYRCDRIYTAIA